MNKHLFIKLIGLFLACFFSNAQATLLTVKLPGDTVNYTTTVGSIFDANIYIYSVADFAGFDFTLSFGSAKLSALSLTSGNIFGITDTEVLVPPTITPNTVNYAEAISSSSLLPSGFNINAPTLLATVKFQALSTGVNNLISFIAPLLLSDFGGNSIGATAQGAFVTINAAVVPPPPPQQQVPEPASAFLFATGLLALFGLRRTEQPPAKAGGFV